jgi:cephalosporin hydroxylase
MLNGAKKAKLFLVGTLVIGLSLTILSANLSAGDDLNDQEIIKRFIHIFYKSEVWAKTKWLGIDSVQFPSDNWVMQEIIFETKPDYVIETGTFKGGTALFFATILEKVNEGGKVITIDIDPQIDEVSHIKLFKERVEVIKGDSVSPEIIDAISKKVKGRRVLVLLDSLHKKDHVLKELTLYSNFVSINSYIIVADTSLDIYGLEPGFGPGPMEAVKEFLNTHENFKIDHSREKFLATFFPSGFLKRIK